MAKKKKVKPYSIKKDRPTGIAWKIKVNRKTAVIDTGKERFAVSLKTAERIITCVAACIGIADPISYINDSRTDSAIIKLKDRTIKRMSQNQKHSDKVYLEVIADQKREIKKLSKRPKK